MTDTHIVTKHGQLWTYTYPNPNPKYKCPQKLSSSSVPLCSMMCHYTHHQISFSFKSSPTMFLSPLTVHLKCVHLQLLISVGWNGSNYAIKATLDSVTRPLYLLSYNNVSRKRCKLSWKPNLKGHARIQRHFKRNCFFFLNMWTKTIKKNLNGPLITISQTRKRKYSLNGVIHFSHQCLHIGERCHV